MKLGIVADEIDRNFANAVRIGTSLGIRRYEIRNLPSGRAPLCDPAELREVEAIVEREGLELTALSPGLFKFTEDEAAFQREMAELYPKAAELAHRWNLPGLITFGFHKPGATEENASTLPAQSVPSQITDWLARAGEQAEKDGLLLIIEPECICWADTAARTANLIDQSGSKALRINYDPGNVAWLQGKDPLDDFEPAAKYIANVHIKDLIPGTPRPKFVPAGQGLINFKAHFAALRRINYQGPISLEPHMDGNPETIRRCRDAAEAENQQLKTENG
jgi:sugar phosphate isomerase/epimerase